MYAIFSTLLSIKTNKLRILSTLFSSTFNIPLMWGTKFHSHTTLQAASRSCVHTWLSRVSVIGRCSKLATSKINCKIDKMKLKVQQLWNCNCLLWPNTCTCGSTGRHWSATTVPNTWLNGQRFWLVLGRDLVQNRERHQLHALKIILYLLRSSRQIPGQFLTLGHGRFLLHPFQVITSHHPVTGRYTVRVTDCIVK